MADCEELSGGYSQEMMGKQNGHGTVTSKDGKYVGEWKGNDFHGQGTMILLMGQNG